MRRQIDAYSACIIFNHPNWRERINAQQAQHEHRRVGVIEANFHAMLHTFLLSKRGKLGMHPNYMSEAHVWEIVQITL